MNGGGNVTFDGDGRLGGMGGADYGGGDVLGGTFDAEGRLGCLELPLGQGVNEEDGAALEEVTPKFRTPRPPPPAPKTTMQAPNPGEQMRRLSVRRSSHNSG
jgi:hypothetical protein